VPSTKLLKQNLCSMHAHISFNDFGTTIFVRYIILCNNSNLLLQIFSKF
jgi:hypothetical protein